MLRTAKEYKAGSTTQVPEMMQAAAVDHFGGPEVLTPHVIPVPKIGPSEVLIAVNTAGVGRWDADIRAGWYPGKKPRFPLVLGTDGAGRIAEVGFRVRRLKIDDEVYSYSWLNPKGGFYAEYVAVESEKVAHIPAGLDLEHAGAIPTTGLTALQDIDDALAVKYHKSIIRRWTPAGADAILAVAGGDALERALQVLRPGGRLAYPNGIEPEPKKRRGVRFIPMTLLRACA